MPKKPSVSNVNIQVFGKPGEEPKIRAFKEICGRNNIEIRSVVLEAVDAFLRQHNWPPGNSQTLLEKFGSDVRVVCMRCHRSFAETEVCRVVYKTGWEASSCVECLKKDKGKGLVKKVGKQT